MLPKNEKLSASAATNSPFTKSELDDLADAAGYSNFGALSNAVKNNETINASTFGDYAVSFGGMDWFPVLATAIGDSIQLTLWLKTSIGNYYWSDGTYGANATYASNNYRYSWIRSAINMGQTPAPDNGAYYGAWPNSTSSASAPTIYNKNTPSASGKVVTPTSFTAFSSILGNPDIVKYIEKGGEYGDYLWLPSTAEAASGGSWGCTSTQWANNGTTGYCWTRTPNPSDYYRAYTLNTSGIIADTYVCTTYDLRPAINIKISGVTTATPTTDETPVTYTGNAIPFPLNYDPTYVDITIDATDPNGNAIPDINEANNISNNSFNATLAGTYKMTLNLNKTATDNDMQWCDKDGGTDKREFTFTINKATPSVSPIFGGSRPFVTSGFPEPDSYTAGYAGIDITGTFSWPSQDIEANISKTYTWLFTPDDEFIDNFNTATGEWVFNFQERKIESMVPTFNAGGATVYTKTSKSDLMKMITLSVTYNDGETVNETNFDITYSLAEGTGNTIMVSFGGQLPKSVDVDVYVELAKVESLILLYNQGSNKLTPLNDINDLKQYLTVYPQWNYTSESEPLGDNDYTLEGELTAGSPTIYVVYEGVKAAINPAPTVTKAVYDTSELKFENKLAPYTGEAFETDGWVTGLPNGVTVTYSCNTDMTAIGTHTVTAHFEGDYDVYEQINDMTAILTIEDNYALPEIVEDTLGYNPNGNTFEISNFEDIKDIVNLTLNGQSVTDINDALTQTEIDEYTLVITLTDGKFLGGSTSVTLTFSIVKCVVEIPVFIDGSLVFNGKTITAKAENFEYNTNAASFVRADGGINAGTTYYAVFKLLDTEHYEWANSGSTRSLVKYSLTDEEELGEGEIQVPWTITKATVTATVADGKMPVFSCATVSDLSGYITYTYYKDELCTEPVEFKNLQPDTRYYVKATFDNEDENFILDDSALGVLNGVSTYDTAAKEPSFIQKALAFIKTNWLWFVVGAAALLLLLIIIVVASKRRKNKEERLAKKEAKEEEKRRREEERQMQREKLEAEREMAKAKQEAELEKIRAQAGLGMGAASMAMQQPMQQQMPVQQQQPVMAQQTMPQYQQPVPQYQQMPMAMPQQMPVMMPQYQQPQGGDNSRIAQLEMEVAKIKAESEIRSTGVDERLKTAYFAHPNSMPAPVERVEAQDKKGMTAELLGEAILSALSKLMDKTPEHPQATEDGKAYPPDAVVTTTTTVDTTKNKPVARSREEDSNFDVDGFYDKYE